MAKAKTAEHSPMFEKYQNRFSRGWCNKEQLRRIVGYGVLTAEEYKEITGEDYE